MERSHSVWRGPVTAIALLQLVQVALLIVCVIYTLRNKAAETALTLAAMVALALVATLVWGPQ